MMIYYYHNNISPEQDCLERRCLVLERLAQTRIFRENQLGIFCHVPLAELTRDDGVEPPEDSGQIFDYLVCKNECVLLAVNLAVEKDALTLPLTLPCLRVITLDRGKVDSHDILQEILGTLESMGLFDPFADCHFVASEGWWQFPGRPIDAQQTRTFVREQLLYEYVPFKAPSRSTIQVWFPTPYGEDCGLMAGCVVQSSGAVCYGTYCASRGRARLEELLAWKKTLPDEVQQQKQPLEQRLRRLNAGRPGNRAHSAALVRQIADSRLDDFLKDFPEELAAVRRMMPSLPSDATYQDVAAICCRLSLPEKEAPYRLANSTIHTIEGTMNCLIKPLLPPGQNGTVQPAEQDSGAPSNPETDGGPPKKIPFAERLDRMKSDREPHFSRDMSIACFLEGVSILARSKYPEWLLRKLAQHYNAPDHYPLSLMLLHSENLIGSGDEEAGDTYDYYGSGRALQFQLLIEPFYLIALSECESG